MEPPLLDTSTLLEKPRNKLVSGGRLNDFIVLNEIEEIEWCDIRTGCKGPWWCCPCQTVTRGIGGCFEGAIYIITCGAVVSVQMIIYLFVEINSRASRVNLL